MQPNQNPMGAVGGVPGAAPAAPTAPVRPAAPAMPSMAVKPEIPEAPAAPAMAPAPVVAKKKGSGMIIGMILLALVATGGIGFGVYMFMEKGNVETSLNKQIKTLKEQNADLLEKLAQMAEQEEAEAEAEAEEELEDETIIEEDTTTEGDTVVDAESVEVETGDTTTNN